MVHPSIDIRLVPGPEALAASVAGAWLNLLTAHPPGTPFTVALPGGRIAPVLFRSFVHLAQAEGASLEPMHFFWGDERCVPPDDPDSNFALARQHLLELLGVPPSRVHRVRGEWPPGEAASFAEAELRGVARTDAAGQPVVDFVLLGMGEDGHTASLFPGESDALVRDPAVFRHVHTTAKPPPDRVTMGYATLAAAANVIVAVSGESKAAALRASVAPGGKTPLARVFHSRSRSLVLTDLPVSLPRVEER